MSSTSEAVPGSWTTREMLCTLADLGLWELDLHLKSPHGSRGIFHQSLCFFLLVCFWFFFFSIHVFLAAIDMKSGYWKLRSVLISRRQLKSWPLIQNLEVCLPELCEEAVGLYWFLGNGVWVLVEFVSTLMCCLGYSLVCAFNFFQNHDNV